MSKLTRQVYSTLVTTGGPQLPTDHGFFHIYMKISPFTFHSPWPPGSQYWYPDSPVQYWMPFYGGSLTDPIEKRGPLLPGPFFAITAAFAVAATIAFLFIGKRFERAREEQMKAGIA